MSIIKKLYKHGHLSIGQTWATDTCYEVIMGSTAYAANMEDGTSDMDIHAITVPAVEMVFPHLTGWVRGFGDAPETFENFQQHHIDAFDKNYDVAIYSIVRAFDLSADNNPNMLDMLWVPDNCVVHIDSIGEHIRKNRKHFLHTGSYHRFRGYAHQQFKRLEASTRTDLIEKYGYDTKSAYHIVRLSLQAEQILEHGDMDFSVNSAFLKEVRKGAFATLDDLKEWYKAKETALDLLYHSDRVTLQKKPNREFLKEVLLACLEMKYGSLDKVYQGVEADVFRKLEQIKQIVNS